MRVEGVISSPGAHGQLVELLKMRRIMVPGDEDDVVEAELTQAMQPRASVVPGAIGDRTDRRARPGGAGRSPDARPRSCRRGGARTARRTARPPRAPRPSRPRR